MIYNGEALIFSEPIKNMLHTKEREHGVSYGLAEAGYDIRIKQDITFYRLFGLIPMVKVVDGNQVSRHFGKFTLASAIEKFNMSPSCVAIVHDKSTWARRALSVFNTVIEPGWKGYLTLELVYNGRKKLHIPAGAGIAQVLFHLVQEPARYDGKYQNQENKPVAARSSK